VDNLPAPRMGSTAASGWEAPLNYNGTNFIYKINHHMRITGLQVDCAFAVITPIQGFAEVLVFGTLSDAKPDIPLVNNPQGFPVMAGEAGTFSDGAAIPYAPGFHSGIVAKGGLFRFIMKEWMPGSSNKTIFVPLNLEAIPGDWITLHADHMGAGPVDFEIQTVMTYELMD